MIIEITRIAVLTLAFVTFNNAFASVLKISTAYPDGTYVVKSLKAAAKQVDEATEGRVKLKFYPGGVQGDNKTVLKKIKRGLLHGALLEGGALASEFKDSQVYNAPMVFNNFDEVDYVRTKLDSEIIAGFANNGWTLFGLIDGGFAYAMTNQPVTNLQKLKQQKLWLPANDPLSEKVANAFSLSPIYLGIGEVLTALQTGAINSIVAPPAAALTLQWYSKVKHVTDAPFMYTYGTLAISNKAFAKLSSADKTVVANILTKAVADVDKNSRADNLKAFSALSTQGLQIIKPSGDDIVSLRGEASKATEVLIKNQEFSVQMLQKVQKLLAEFRAE